MSDTLEDVIAAKAAAEQAAPNERTDDPWIDDPFAGLDTPTVRTSMAEVHPSGRLEEATRRRFAQMHTDAQPGQEGTT